MIFQVQFTLGVTQEWEPQLHQGITQMRSLLIMIIQQQVVAGLLQQVYLAGLLLLL